MGEFLKNNVTLKDMFWIFAILIPGIITWSNVQSAQMQQRLEINEIKVLRKEELKEINDKIDKVLIEMTNIKIQLEKKKNIKQ